jgi:3-deoxy-D-manno-octulosonic-acid transferase
LPRGACPIGDGERPAPEIARPASQHQLPGKHFLYAAPGFPKLINRHGPVGSVRNLYNILFLLGFVLSSPYYFWRMWRRGNWRNGFGERFANYDTKLKQALTNRQTLWLHAVSVGEVGLCTQLIKALEPRVPNAKVVVSTTTTTGMGELKKRLPTHISKIYYPIDRRSYVARAQAVVHPCAIILVEAEIWPNFIWRAKSQRIPLFLVNARISDRSYRGYKRFGFLFRQLFAAFDGVGAQTEQDAQRLIEIGCRPEVVQVVGSMKFDAARATDHRTLNVPALLWQAGAKPGAPLLVCGSTHDGEEALLGELFLRLRQQIPDLFLVIVPRHFERTREVERDLQSRGVKYILRSDLYDGAKEPAADKHCLVVNTTGELKFFYEHATVVFVGKSLTAEGGQNPIEPCALGKPTVFGPNMQNFADVVSQFLAQDAVVQVGDVKELESVLAQLFTDPARREQLGRNGVAVVQQNLGAIARTTEMILNGVNGSGLYIAPPK